VTPPTNAAPIDYSPLTAPIARGEVAAFRAESKAKGRNWSAWNAGSIVTVVAVVAVVGIFLFTGTAFTRTALGSAVGNGVAGLTPGAVILLVILLAVVILAIVIGARGGFTLGTWERWMRMDRFATANGLLFSPRDADPAYPGMIFARGHSRFALDHIRSTTGRFLDIGNYRYTTGSGKNAQTHNWGFMAFALDRKLPHMVLDSTANNGLFGSNLDVGFSRQQVLSLEGDFDRYFTLYCPQEYERDALYVFTPDLMALLIDEASPFDVEIIDDWMFVYSATRFPVADPAVFERLFRIIDTVGTKTLTQTDHYSDERVGDPTVNLVAPEGQRLKRGIRRSTIIVIGILAAYWLVSFLIGTPGLFRH